MQLLIRALTLAVPNYPAVEFTTLVSDQIVQLCMGIIIYACPNPEAGQANIC